MSLRAKFIIFMLAFLVTASILGFGAFYIFRNLSLNLGVLEQEVELSNKLHMLEASIDEVIRSVIGWSLTKNEGFARSYRVSATNVNKELRELEKLMKNKDSIRALADEFRELKKLSDGLISERGPRPAGILESIKMLEMLRDEIISRLRTLQKTSLESATNVVETGKLIRQNMTIYLTLLIIFSLITMGFLIILLQRMFEEPYEGMLKATEKVSSGELSYRIGSKRKDEYGIIANRFDNMVSVLEESDKKLKGKLRETELFLSVAQLAGTVPVNKEAFKLMAKTIAEKTEKDLCNIYKLKPEKNAFCPLASSLAGVEAERCIGLGSDIAKAMIQGLTPINIEDISANPRLKLFDGYESYLWVPIMKEGSCTGLLLLACKNKKCFTDDDKNTSMILAHTIGVAMWNTELYEASKSQVQQLSILYQLSKALTSLYRPEELLKTIAEEVIKLINARGCIIRLLEDGMLNVKSQAGLSEISPDEVSLPIGKGIPGFVAKEGRSLFIEDMSKMPDEIRVSKVVAKSAICVPLKLGDRVIGTLGIYDKIASDGTLTAFTYDDLAIVEGFASLSAATIERARMLDEELKREHEIFEAKKRLDLIFESVQGGLITVNKEYIIIAANKYIERWIDIPRSEIIGKSMLDVFHQKGGICPHCAAYATFDSGDINTITQSSGLNYAELTSYPIKDESGSVNEAVVFIQDITDRVLYQEEIMGLYREVTQSKDYIESLINNSADAIITTDVEGRVNSWNPAAERIYLFTKEEVMDKFLPFVPEFLLASERENLQKIKAGEVLNYETIRKRKDGQLIEVSLTLSPIKDASGNVIGVSGISRDISERKKMEKELIRRNQELSRLFFISSAMRGTLDLERLLRMVLTAVTMSDGLGFNRAILFLVDEETGKLRGQMGVGPASAEEAWTIWDSLSLEKKTLPELVKEIEEGPLKKDSFLDRLSIGIEIPISEDTVLARAVRERRPYNVPDVKSEPAADTILIQQLGTTAYAVMPLVSRNSAIGAIWVDNFFNKRPITEDDMKFLTGFADQVASGIESARLFQKVSLAEAELENIFTSISDMVYFTDKDYNLRRINKAVSEKVSIPQEELIGKKCYQVFHGMNEPWPMCPHHKTVETLKPHIEELEDSYMKGTFLTSTSPIFDTDGNFIGTVHIVRDITELKNLREKLQTAERMAALGEVAAKVAHEIRNPLVSVGGFAKRLEAKLDGNLKGYASIISKEVTRLEAILKEILGFVRETRILRRVVNISELLQDTVNLIAHEISDKGNTIVTEFEEPPLIFIIDPDRMREAIMNILVNANQATDGGTITIKTYKEAPLGVIEISDTGCGIKEEDIGRIFDPFFTTRPMGTGLGLAIARRIIEEHSGHITVESKPGEGTKFKIYLTLKED